VTFDFALRFIDGKGFLGLRETRAATPPSSLDPLEVNRLDLEIPNIRFPFDVSGDAGRFRTRRCLLTAAELRLDEERLQAWLDARRPLERFGLTELRARLADGRVELAARARVGEREASLTARIVLRTDAGQQVRAYLGDVRLYGFLPAPAPLVALGLALGLGAQTRDGAGNGEATTPRPIVRGLDLVELNPLEIVLWRTLPPAGWRLPRYRDRPLVGAEVGGGRIAIRYGVAPAALPSGGVLAPPPSIEEQVHARCRDADELLVAGKLTEALEAYTRLAEAEPQATLPQVLERQLAVLAALPTRFDEALALGARLEAQHPERPFASLAQAAVEAERDQHAAAAARYARVVELADRAGEPLDALEAALRAGELYARAPSSGAAATRWLERVLADRPDHPRASALLAERYAAEQRWHELLHLEKRRLTQAEGPRAEVAAHLRLGRLWLEHLGDPTRARDELERALRVDERDAAVWSLYARALEGSGDPTRALEALGRAAQLSDDGKDQVETHLRAATLAERAGAVDAALGHLERALAGTGGNPDALGRAAAILVRIGRLDDAVAAYQRAADAATDETQRARLFYDLAVLAESTQHDVHGARAYVEKSLALAPSPEALRLAADLAERDGRLTDLARLAGELGDRGDRAARLRQARALAALGRHAEAAEAAEEVAATLPREALPLVVEARLALGQPDARRKALERLVVASPAAAPRVQLAQLCADDGDLDEARALLQEALQPAGEAPPSPTLEREALEILCDVLLRQGDDAALDRALGRLAATRPEDDPIARARALSAQGAARARLGLTAEAAESYRAALALEPDSAQARAGLAEAAYALRRWDEARAALEPLHQRGLPPRVERALRLGELADRLGQPVDAIGFYQAALEAGASGADGARAWNSLIALYHGRADHDAEARAQLAAADDERLTESDTARAGRLVAAADILRKRAGRVGDAIVIYDRALALDPLHLAALDALEAIAESHGEWTHLAQVLSRKVAATAKRPAQQKAILGRLAQLQADRLGRPDAAREAYARALALDPDFRPALHFLAAEARGRGDAAEETARLERLVALAPDPVEPESRPAELVRLAQLYRGAGKPDDAERAARRALALAPRHLPALVLLDELFAQSGATDGLIDVLQLRAQGETDFDQMVALLLRRAGLLEQAGRRKEAIAAYEQITSLRSADAPAWNRLAALLRREESWEALVAVLTRLAEVHAADGRREEAAALTVEIAHLAHDRLHDAAQSHRTLTRALEIDPGSRIALAGLLALARARGDEHEEDALLGRIADLEETPAARAHAVAERARLRNARGDADGAHALVAELDVEVAPEAALRLRVEIEEARGTPAEATPALEALRARAHAANDAAGERYAVKRLARLAAAAGPTRAAEDLFRRAVELDADDRDAARALADLEHGRGDERAYLERLEQLLRTARRTFEGAAREAELCLEMATVLRSLGDLDGARARLRDALDAAPRNGAAWRLYGQVQQETGALTAAADALEHARGLGALDPPGLAALGELYLRLDDAAHASDAFEAAGDAAPRGRYAEALERAGHDDAARAAWRAVGGAAARRHLAELARRHAAVARAAGHAEAARAAALDALVGDPGDAEALAWASDGLAPDAALDAVERAGTALEPAEAAAVLRAFAARSTGAAARRALARAAELAPDAATLLALGRASTGEAAADAFAAALQLDPASVDAALGLAAAGRAAEAARALEGPAANAPRAALALGTLRRDALGDAAGARAAFERALQTSNEVAVRAEAGRALAALDRAGGDLAAAEQRLAALVADGTASDDDQRALAELLAGRGAKADAIPLLERAGGAPDLLAHCLEGVGRHADLLALLEREAPRRAPDEARALWRRAADVAAGPLADAAHAVELYERALALGPNDADGWVRLARLYETPLGRADDAAHSWERAQAADPERTDVLLPLADHHRARGEWARARDLYQRALARGAVRVADVGPVQLRIAEAARAQGDAAAEEAAVVAAGRAGATEEALPRLIEILRARGDAARLAPMLKLAAQRAAGPKRAALLREAATLLPPEETAAIDEKILQADPTDDAARERIIARLRGGDPAALIARLADELARAGARRGAFGLELGRLAQAQKDPLRAARGFHAALEAGPSLEAARGLFDALARQQREFDAAPLLDAAFHDARLPEGDRAELAALTTRAYLAPGGDGARALAWIERTRAEGLKVSLDPVSYRGLLRAQERHDELLRNLDESIVAAEDRETRLTLALESVEVLERGLRRPGDAARRLAAIADRLPARRDLVTRARALYAAAGEPIPALALLEKELAQAAPDELPQLKIVRGELLLAAGADAEAEAEFLHALITTPRVGRAHAALAEVYKRRGDVAGALEHLIAAADAADLEPPRAAACAIDAADVLVTEGDTATAERLYQLAAALDASDRRPIDGLARLAAARGEHERQADLLGRAAALTADPPERARLALARAKLYRGELGRELEAYRCFKEAVACDPTSREAARGLREMAEARGEWALAAEQRYREIAQTPAAAERARLHLELARLLEEKLLETDEATRNYEQAAELGDHPDPWRELVRLYTGAQRVADAANAAERLALSLADPVARAEALARAGELYERAGDEHNARARLAEAAAIGGEAGRKADERLLRITAQAGDVDELRTRIEERLAIEPEGEVRLELLRRLLALAADADDLDELDARAQEVLARAPEDEPAFRARRRVLESRGDDAGVIALLRARAAAVSDAAERAARLFEAGRLGEVRLFDPAAVAADYEAALAADPRHIDALDALADLAYRTRHTGRARFLYAQLGDRSSRLGRDEIARRRAELAESAGDLDEAKALYQTAVQANPSNLEAQEALARMALDAGDDPAAYAALRAVLDLLPLDAVDRITELRGQLGDLALRLGEVEPARGYFELVLAQEPTRIEALGPLLKIYIEAGEAEEAAELCQRLAALTVDPHRRAELLYRRGELLREGVGDLDRANDAYLKAADLHPMHAPTLRRLVSYYYHEGDHTGLVEVVRELEAIPAPLDDAAVHAGLGLALAGDEARGTIVVALAQPSAERLAEALAAARVTDLGALDAALKASTRALGGGEAGRRALIDALRAQLRLSPDDLGARLALARLYDVGGESRHAQLHYAVPAFVDAGGRAAARLRELGAPLSLPLSEEQLVHPSARGPLRDALVALAPLLLGLPLAPAEADPSPPWTERLRPVANAVGVTAFEAAVVVDLPDAAWAEPSRPPRLLMPRRTLHDDAVARFATVRALHALASGVPLVEGRAPEDVAALVRAAAALFLPDLRATMLRASTFVHAWQAELTALPLRPDALPGAAREHLEVVLAACIVDPVALSSAPGYAVAERLTADRFALAATGDLRAALAALCPADATSVDARADALTESPAIAELLAFVGTIS
jgi:tetratricopeptide (TPR) repeat protein